MLLASLVLRTRAISSALTLSCAATRRRDRANMSLNLLRLLNEQSRSISAVSTSTVSVTERKAGQRLAAFMGMELSLKENCARTIAQ